MVVLIFIANQDSKDVLANKAQQRLLGKTLGQSQFLIELTKDDQPPVGTDLLIDLGNLDVLSGEKSSKEGCALRITTESLC